VSSSCLAGDSKEKGDLRSILVIVLPPRPELGDLRSILVIVLPPRPELLVSEGESINLDQPSTRNPNTRGFDQGGAETWFQDPLCVLRPFVLLRICCFGTTFLVLKE
jgi:hypothetical protein